MQKLIGGVLSVLVSIGVAWGIIQYVGEGSPFLSDEWFAHWDEKWNTLQGETSDKIEENLPNPDEVNDAGAGEQ